MKNDLLITNFGHDFAFATLKAEPIRHHPVGKIKLHQVPDMLIPFLSKIDTQKKSESYLNLVRHVRSVLFIPSPLVHRSTYVTSILQHCWKTTSTCSGQQFFHIIICAHELWHGLFAGTQGKMNNHVLRRPAFQIPCSKRSLARC